MGPYLGTSVLSHFTNDNRKHLQFGYQNDIFRGITFELMQINKNIALK